MFRHLAPLLLAALPAAAEPIDPGSVAFFGLHFMDTSTEGAINGVRPDETERLAKTAEYVEEGLASRGFAPVDIAPALERLARVKNPARCNGCETALARDLGARYAATGEVQKTSNLILTLNFVLKDAESGAIVRGGSVEIRGNDDTTWQRGYRYLLRNTIFPENPETPE